MSVALKSELLSRSAKPRGSAHWMLLNLVFFCSGLAALVYEVSWNRQFGILFGHT